jgi:hypothetical protein
MNQREDILNIMIVKLNLNNLRLALRFQVIVLKAPNKGKNNSIKKEKRK